MKKHRKKGKEPAVCCPKGAAPTWYNQRTGKALNLVTCASVKTGKRVKRVRCGPVGSGRLSIFTHDPTGLQGVAKRRRRRRR